MEDFEVISTYTAEQAVEDGVLIELGKAGGVPVYATVNCFFRAGLDNSYQRKGVVMEALAALHKRDPQDTPGFGLRVLHKGIAADYDCLWVVFDGTAVTIMFPEDY